MKHKLGYDGIGVLVGVGVSVLVGVGETGNKLQTVVAV